MADVKLDWTVPAGSVDMTNIDSFVIHKSTASGAACSDLNTAALNATSPVATITNLATTTYTDTNVSAGTYLYGIFAKNGAGVSPCLSGDASVATVTVT